MMAANKQVRTKPVPILTARDALAERVEDYVWAPMTIYVNLSRSLSRRPPRRWYAAPAVRPVANCATAVTLNVKRPPRRLPANRWP
ncbi:hypothetical protein KCP70_07335 [Salmonella enterica subsp. enterica]|nr:hypothetical protein KCP70_07335 [Salmonella enterica subsp. enterica]